MALQGILANPVGGKSAGAPAAASAPAPVSAAPAVSASSPKPSSLKGILASPIQKSAANPLPPPTDTGLVTPAPETSGVTTPAVAKPGVGMTFGDVLSGLKAIPGIAYDAVTAIPKAIVDSEIHPSVQEQSTEKQLQSHPSDILSKALDFLPNTGVALTTRFFQPMFQPVADTLTTILQTPDIADQVAKGQLPSSAIEEQLPALQKSSLQVIGETVIAGISVYLPDIAGGTISKAASGGVMDALKQGGRTGAVAGGVFATAQVLASGTTDPKQIAKIYAENIVGGTLIGGITHSAIPLSKGAFDKATKDIQSTYNMPEYVYIDGTKIKDIFQTNSLASDSENELIRSLGLNADQYKKAFTEGLTIEIPSQNITTITDKPYWAQIKDSFGFKPTNKTIRAEATPQVSERIMNPARQLPSPEDVRAKLDAGKTPEAVKYELQRDMPKAQAEEIVKQAQELPAAKPEEAPQAEVLTELPKTVDENVLNKTPGEYQQDFASVQVAHDEKVRELQDKVSAIEKQIADSKPQSVEKKNLKIQLSDVKNTLTEHLVGNNSVETRAAEHATALHSFLQEHLQTTHGIPSAEAPAVARDVISHIIKPSLIEKHVNTPLREIASRVATEHKAAKVQGFMTGDTVSIKDFPGVKDGEYKIEQVFRMPNDTKYHLVGGGKDFWTDKSGMERATKPEKAPVRNKPKSPAEKAAEKAKKAKATEKKVETHMTAIRDAYSKKADAQEQLTNLMAELLEISQAGFRSIHDETGEAYGSPSTFPKWLPDNLKNMSLFRSVFGKTKEIADLAFPTKANATRQRELYDYVLSMLDYRLGVDTTKERGAILALYGKEAIASEASPAGQDEVPSPYDSGASRSRAKEEIAFASVPEEKVTTRPKTSEEAANRYYKEVIAPQIQTGTVVIDTDQVRAHFGDFGKDTRPIYAKAAQIVLDRALFETKGKGFALVGGGAGSGKSEFLTKSLVGEKFKGVIYDSTMSSPDFVLKLIEKAKSYGKEPEAHIIIADPEEARFWTLVREAETGRPVEQDFFVKAHSGYPETALKLAEEDVPLFLYDARGKSGEQIAQSVSEKTGSPIDVIKKLDYNENTIRAKAQAAEQYYGYNNEQTGETNEAVSKDGGKELQRTQSEGGQGAEGNRGKEKGVIPKELRALAEEAKKYATVEEFIKAQINAYHGTPNKEFDSFQLGRSNNTENETNGLGVWVTPQESAAKIFSNKIENGMFGTGSSLKDVGGTVMPVHILLKNPKVYESTKGMESLLDEIERLRKEKPTLTALHFTDDPIKRNEIVKKRDTAEAKIEQLKREYQRDAFEHFMDDRDQFASYIEKSAKWDDRYIANDVAGTNKKFIEYLKSKGHDGIKIEGTKYDAKDTGHDVIDQVVVFDPKNVLTRAQLSRIYESVKTDHSSMPEKPPREPKPKTEKASEAPAKVLDKRELYNAERAIEQNKPRGYAGTVLKEVSTWFNPRGQAQTPAVDVIMQNKGEYERILFRTERATREIKKMWDAHSQDVALDFMDKVERGALDEIPAEFRPLAEMYRERLTNTWAAIQEFKDVPFMENYFPHLWKDPKAVAEANVWAKANARRPLQGNKSFLKQRVFATIQDGIKAGYELQTHNPEELVQLHEQNVQKFLMANRILDDLKARGFAKLVKSGGKNKIPDGFARLEDSIAKVYLNPNIPILEAYDEHVYNALADVISGLGLEHDRQYNIGKAGALGFTRRGTSKITTKFGTPLSVVAHELGHQLDYKYDLQKVFKTDPNRTYGSESDYTQKELRKLADLRFEGHEVTDSYKAYIRSAPEKMAVMLEAYVHAPERFKEVAPRTFEKFTEFLASHKETAPILEIKPSLVYGVREDSIYAGGAILGGEYWLQKDVARMLNNYLSPDRIMDTALGKGIMNVKNTMNAFELGFSAFHLTMETLDTMITKFSIGLGKVSHGNFTGFGDMLKAPITPASYFRAGQKFYNGDPELLKIENDLFTGGASLREKQYYKNTVFDTFLKQNREIMGQIRRGEMLGAAKATAFNVLRLPMAAVEATMRPLFTYYIPRLKVGAFRDLFAAELERNSQRIQDGEMTRASIARDVWNNIENRMGELNYDNLFWHRNLKTGLMLATRAVGWNLGTAREIGGALFQDLPREAFNAARGKGFNFTPKMAYTLSLFFFVATLGATYQYLHTGKKPGSVKDLFYPRNGATTAAGEPYRIEFPTYLKDIYQSGVPQLLTGKPFGAFDSFSSMLKNKAAPELTALFNIMNNKDFFQNEIRNPHDNAPTQAKQLALYLISTLTPFTLQQQQKLAAGKSTLEQQAEAFFGIIGAPKAIIQSDYNAQLEAIYQDQNGLHAPETPEQQATYTAKQAVVDQIKKGDYSGIQGLVNSGAVKPSGVRQFIQNAVLTTPQKQYKFLSPQNKLKINGQ